MPPTRRQRSAERRRIESLKPMGSCCAIDQFDREIHEWYLKQLVVEGRHSITAEQLIQRNSAEPVDCAKNNAAQFRSRRCRRIRKQQMHSKEDGDRNIRIVEKVDAGCGKVRKA